MPIYLVSILGGLSVGILGSIHCIGMCGPIALVLPLQGKQGYSRLINILAYNIGRAFTYAILGAFIGLIGESIALFGWQQKISVVSGLFILVLLIKNKWSNFSIPFLDKLLHKVKTSMQIILSPSTGLGGLFLLGMLNGLLPCGLVYVALTSAVALTSIANSTSYMFFFGIGTIPAMLSISIFQKPVLKFLKGKGRYVINTFVSLMALLLIVRGLGLGIPYISPKINVSSQHTTVDCCHRGK